MKFLNPPVKMTPTQSLMLICGLCLALPVLGKTTPPAAVGLRGRAPVLLATTNGQRVQLLELFSSEGCSSCPPAEEWASKLQSSPELFKAFIPVVFHVDYWNSSSWKDPYSSALITKRQLDLSRLWKTTNIYTPEFVLSGVQWKNWRADESGVPLLKGHAEIALSIYKNQDGSFAVKAGGLEPAQKYIVRLAQLGMGLSSNVTGGENSGRHLTHDFVVLNWDDKPISSQANQAVLIMKAPLQKAKRFAMVAWVEKEGTLAPVQAVGGYLE